MSANLDDLFDHGGKAQHDLLSFSVLSVRLEGLFVFLVREYAAAPTAAKAVALYDIFCAVGAEGRLSCSAALPPLAPRLSQAIEPLRAGLERKRNTPAEPANPVFVPVPPKFLFDDIVRSMRDDPASVLHQIALDYDPTRTPHENLPDGRLNAGQRYFVERVWRPRLRPRLVEVGFWRIATVGG